MALRSGYKGFKKLLPGLKLIRPGTLGIDNDVLIPELNKIFFPRSEQAVLGAKNFLPNTAVSMVVNAVTYTVNADKTISANGTASSNAYITICENHPIPKGDYIITGGEDLEDKFSDYGIFLTINDTTYGTRSDIQNIHLEQDSVITLCRVFINANKQVDNIKIEPMIRLASDPDNTYVPYAMTNRALTDSAADQKTAINAIITAATSAADFVAFKTAMGAITPVTRSLSLTKEDITEEVKEDVEPEKTVTKKRTTKKTEEV